MEWLSCFPNKTIIFGVCICLVLKLIVRSLKSTNSHSWSTGIDRAFTWHLTFDIQRMRRYWFDWAELNMWWLISYDTRSVCLMIGWREISGCLGGDGYIPMGVQLEPADETEWEKMKLIGWLVKHMPAWHMTESHITCDADGFVWVVCKQSLSGITGVRQVWFIHQPH